MTLVPRYGRDYKSKKEVLAAFDANKDFTVADISSPWDDKAVNKEDLKREGIRKVMIRYRKLTQIAVVKIGE